MSYMSAEEVMIHIRMGEGMRYRGSRYIMSYEKYRRLERSLEHYLDTGEIFEGKWGLQLREDVNDHLQSKEEEVAPG